MEIVTTQAKKRGGKVQRVRKSPAKSIAQSNKNDTQKVEKESQAKNDEDEDEEEEEGELCFICTEAIVTFAVAQCDHRTCHRCTLRLRALYETRNCAYCKVS
jgi:hypothetical protein